MSVFGGTRRARPPAPPTTRLSRAELALFGVPASVRSDAARRFVVCPDGRSTNGSAGVDWLCSAPGAFTPHRAAVAGPNWLCLAPGPLGPQRPAVLADWVCLSQPPALAVTRPGGGPGGTKAQAQNGASHGQILASLRRCPSIRYWQHYSSLNSIHHLGRMSSAFLARPLGQRQPLAVTTTSSPGRARRYGFGPTPAAATSSTWTGPSAATTGAIGRGRTATATASSMSPTPSTRRSR